MTDLLPCPFCGKPPILDVHCIEDAPFPRDDIRDVEFVVVRCSSCGISKEQRYRSDAVEWWNKRLQATPSRPASGEDWSCVADFLDDIPVDEKGLCNWTDVANAQTHIRAAMRCAQREAPAVSPQTRGTADEDFTAGVERLRACAAPPAHGADSWQPIETAPKDGTEINGYRPDQGVFTFRWAEMSEFVDEDAIVDGHGSEFACWWHDRWGWMENDLTPTGWQPLPAEPAVARAEFSGGEA